MSLDALLGLLARKAEQEAEELLADARARADAIVREAEDRAGRRREAELARLDEANRRAVAQETASVERKHRALKLEERARVLGRVFDRARERLNALESDRYGVVVPALLSSTLQYLERAPATLECRDDVAELVRRLCDGAAQVQVRTSEGAAAGILGESADGRTRVDNTLPALLARRREELSVAVAARLED